MPRNTELVLSTEQRKVRSETIQSIRIELLCVRDAGVFATFAIKVHTVNLQPQAKRQSMLQSQVTKLAYFMYVVTRYAEEEVRV